MFYPVNMACKAWWTILIVASSLLACNVLPSTEPVVPSPTPISARRTVTPISETIVRATGVAPTQPPIAASSAMTLTLWTTEELAPGTTPAGRLLRNQLDAFTAANPNIRLQIGLKKAYGKGGLLDSLLTTREIVPERLPDLVALDLSEIPLAAQARILQPLDNWLSAEARADFFPFAALAAQYNQQWVAVPFVADAEHLVYHRSLVRKPPTTWDEFTKQKASLLIPLGGDDGFLVQYYALGASPTTPPDGQLLDVNATAQVLNFIKRGRDLGLIPDSALAIKSVDEVWVTFASGQVAMAQASAARYLAEREKMPNVSYAPIPTRDGKAATIANGWALAIVSRDAARQSAAARFIQWMLASERLAPWLKAARRLPTNRATVALAIEPAEYAAFLRDQLEHAASLPAPATIVRQSDAWRTAIGVVWKGQATPAEAAHSAATIR